MGGPHEKVDKARRAARFAAWLVKTYGREACDLGDGVGGHCCGWTPGRMLGVPVLTKTTLNQELACTTDGVCEGTRALKQSMTQTMHSVAEVIE